jgi:hypothetical protein
MKPKLLSWNVRGLNESDKKANIICLHESKLEHIFSSVVQSL